MPPEKVRKPRGKPALYNRTAKPGPKPGKASKPATSAKSLSEKEKKENLTINDWLLLFDYMDQHPGTSQTKVAEHFRTKKNGALFFTQGALSKRLKDRAELEAQCAAIPNVASSKRIRVVTCPQVDRALFAWVKHMEDDRGENVTGPMLKAKRRRFEQLMNIPEDQWLEGDGWIPSFCKAYGIKERRRHGEAGSADLAAVEKERGRCRHITKKYSKKDTLNIDESSFFTFAPPDHGLCTRVLSGKKKNKFRITITLTVNADGSEQFEPFFIGKSKGPVCFGRKSPNDFGYYYRHNKKAWMNTVLFEEYIQHLDRQMRAQNRHVLLLLDNFSGHTNLSYKPTNVELEYFEPNLTAHVQPLDAGIIRTFKAHYRRLYCLRAVDLNSAGADDIFAIDLKEAMAIALEAWELVTPLTIQHCWEHTQILGHKGPSSSLDTTSSPSGTSSPFSDPGAWDILRRFSTDNDMTLPVSEDTLKEYLGNRYDDKHWRPAFNAVMGAENDQAKATAALKAYSDSSSAPSS